MYYEIAPYILRNRKRFIPLALSIVFLNFFFSQLIQGNIAEFKDTITSILLLNGFWFLIYFAVIQWTYVARNWLIYEASPAMAPLGIILCMLLLAISIPVVWFDGNQYWFSSFTFIWWILFSAIVAESNDLEDSLDGDSYFPANGGGIYFYNITLNNDIVFFTSSSNEKSFMISDIRKLDMTVAGKNRGFFVTVVTDKICDFSLHYTKMNFEVLQGLIRLCKTSVITIEDLEKQVRRAFWPFE